MIKKLLYPHLLFLLFFTGGLLHAQTYRFFEENGSYQDLSNDIDHQTVFDAAADFLDLDLTFKLYDEEFNFDGNAGLAVGEGGFISATNTLGTRAFVIDGFFISGNSSIALNNSSKISYKLEGNAGEHILKIQWKDIALQNGPAGEFFNFQLWLFQKNGNIELHYGPNNLSSAAFAGAGGPAIGVFLAKNDFSQIFETAFLVGQSSNLSTDTVNIFATMDGFPTNGTIYKFSASTVGLKEFNAFNSSVHPNPVENKIYVDSEEILESARIKDIQGKIVRELTLSGRKETINLNELKEGLYFLELKSINNTFSHSKFIKL